jgi:hypothetical protein
MEFFAHVQVNLTLLIGLAILFPLTEAIGSLLKFAQRRDIFILDFIAMVKVC